MPSSSETTALLSGSTGDHERGNTSKGNPRFISPVRQYFFSHSHNGPDENQIHGPLSFCNPTCARFKLSSSESRDEAAPDSGANGGRTGEGAPLTGGAHVEWRSRANRKGRHVLVVPASHGKNDTPLLSSNWASIAAGIWRMLTVFAWWDVSWWIGVLFSVGCMLFVICGFCSWLPLAAPNTKFPGESMTGGVSAFVGATLFAFAGVLLIVEAINEDQSACFGWAIEQTYEQVTQDAGVKSPGEGATDDGDDGVRVQNLTPSTCCHRHGKHHHHRAQDQGDAVEWEWWPTWKDLRSHYLHEIGFLGSAVLAAGTIVFWVTGIMSLPQIQKRCSEMTMYLTYWLAFLVGGILFTTSSALYMLENQSTWYKPAPKLLGWWIGLFNLIGSVGWTLSASFGYCSAGWCEFQSHLSLLWASVAFLTGSLLLWYEALDKYPVEREDPKA